MEDAGKRKTW